MIDAGYVLSYSQPGGYLCSLIGGGSVAAVLGRRASRLSTSLMPIFLRSHALSERWPDKSLHRLSRLPAQGTRVGSYAIDQPCQHGQQQRIGNLSFESVSLVVGRAFQNRHDGVLTVQRIQSSSIAPESNAVIAIRLPTRHEPAQSEPAQSLAYRIPNKYLVTLWAARSSVTSVLDRYNR